MRLDAVETFYWAATLNSVTEASKRTYITQTAASERIATLERELGRTLLERRPDKRFRLTGDGERFLVDAKRLLQLWREIKVNMQVDTWRQAALRIGVIESVLHSWLMSWIEHLAEALPAIKVELTVETSPMLGETLRRGALDLVVAAHPVSGQGIRSQALAPMEMAFVGSRMRHRARRYSLPQIAQLELLTFQRGSQPHVALLDVLKANGLEPPVVHALSSISAMCHMVQAGFGVATLPSATLANFKGLRALPCATRLPNLPLHLSFREDPASSALDTMLSSLPKFVRAGRRRSARKS